MRSPVCLQSRLWNFVEKVCELLVSQVRVC